MKIRVRAIVPLEGDTVFSVEVFNRNRSWQPVYLEAREADAIARGELLLECPQLWDRAESTHRSDVLWLRNTDGLAEATAEKEKPRRRRPNLLSIG